MPYQRYGLTSMHEFVGDMVVYRNLVPCDPRIPALDDLRGPLGLEDRIPRKAEPVYGRVVAEMLRQARAVDRPGVSLERLLYVGDTALNDGTAFRNICAAGPWPGWCFIGRDTLGAPLQEEVEGALYVANRWSALPSFLRHVEGSGFLLDERTAVVVDMDKTAVGARGRNDGVINAARVEGVQRTVAGLLGPEFDLGAFRRAYDELNQAAYYGLTADNQDYLAYICLILGAGLYALEEVVGAVRAGELGSFDAFIGGVQDRRDELVPSGLAPIHDGVWDLVQRGDPTPFKAFRYNEYLTTAACFGDRPKVSPDALLEERIAITEEVRQAALGLRARGALLFALSDKPDEASLPSAEQAAAGMLGLHRLETVSVGAV